MNVEAATPAFFDTNILVYAVSKDSERSAVAWKVMREAQSAGGFRISTQVLQEFFVTVTRQNPPLLSPDVALSYIDTFCEFPVTALDARAVRRAAQVSVSARLSLWDAQIVVAARESGAELLYTEDLQHGQEILGVKIVNPFRVDRPVQ